MTEFSVFNYATKSKDAFEHFGFIKCSQTTYHADYPVVDDASITVKIDTETKQVEVWRTYEAHPMFDAKMRDDVIPFGLNVKCIAEFGKWLDDAIWDCWYALKDMETPIEYQTCDEPEEDMDTIREEWL